MDPTAKANQPSTQLPEWETPHSQHRRPYSYPPHKSTRYTDRPSHPPRSQPRLLTWFDAHLPRYRTYLGLTRFTFLLGLLFIFLIFLALIIGLAVGLSHRSTRGENLPLPTTTRNFTGDLTYYTPGLGACGIVSTVTDDVCAVSHLLYDAAATGSNPNSNSLCGLKIRATRFDELVNAQRSVDLMVVDRCTGCKASDLDLSPGAFEKLADMGRGRVRVMWAWLEGLPTG